ncbi:GNAT family N-acetyltransferase [Paractinoplanes globisporus]|uniref:GNAT family N-acetyltransferase n=1 Tax=Paractinoplanes globisporus TaxID=113565 RepID=A0ABW6WID1_9ACTN|nr:GNAT family N-acetyltransferase [Actinoplanes globisporus]
MTIHTLLPRLRIAGEPDIDLVADVVADAFDHLEVINWLVPDPDRRWQVSRAWYRLYIEHAIRGAGQVVLTEDHAACAVWFDRTGPVTEPANYGQRLAALAGAHLGRFEHLDTQMDTHHPSAPHWHLLFLAVRPGQQGRGMGSHLMSHTHKQLDVQGLPAYLEATNDDNARLYRRHRYSNMVPFDLSVADGISLYRMWRAPQPVTA